MALLCNPREKRKRDKKKKRKKNRGMQWVSYCLRASKVHRFFRFWYLLLYGFLCRYLSNNSLGKSPSPYTHTLSLLSFISCISFPLLLSPSYLYAAIMRSYPTRAIFRRDRQRLENTWARGLRLLPFVRLVKGGAFDNICALALGISSSFMLSPPTC